MKLKIDKCIQGDTTWYEMFFDEVLVCSGNANDIRFHIFKACGKSQSTYLAYLYSNGLNFILDL